MKHIKDFQISYSIEQLMTIISQSSKRDSIKSVIDSFDDVNILSKFGNTPLIMAVSYQLVTIIKELLEHGADTNIPNNSPIYPISLAAKGNRESCIEIIKILTDAGASWSVNDKDNKYMFDYLNSDNSMKLKNLYPDKHKEYILYKNTDKFNI